MANNPTIWCQEDEMPQSGIQCPKCGRGYLNKSQYGIWCPSCKTNWKLSKFPPKKVIPTGEPPVKQTKPAVPQWSAPVKEVKLNPELVRGLGLIRGDIKKLNEEIDKILKLLEKGTVYYPKTEEPPYKPAVSDKDSIQPPETYPGWNKSD